MLRIFARSPEERMAATTRVGSIKKHFRTLPDPRVVGRTRHLLLDVIVMAICAVIADSPEPNCFPPATATAITRYRVRLSGSFTCTCARPFASVSGTYPPRVRSKVTLAPRLTGGYARSAPSPHLGA